MKRFFLLAFSVVLLSGAVSCKGYKYETVEGDPLGTKIYTLDNGLKVFMSVNKEQPRIQTYIAVKVGGKNDPSETTGLAHYFEHLMFKGTQNFGTSDYAAEKPMLDEIEQLFEVYRATADEAERAEIYRRIDSISYEASKIAIPNEYDKLMAVIGANGTNAWTSKDETVYTEDIPSNQIDNWARIQADRFRNIVIRGFHTELETIYEEKNMSLTRDTRKIWEALDNALYPNHPYGRQTVLGTQEHLKNPSITNVKKYHDNFYVPNNIAICMSGDFDPDEAVAAIEKYFGDWEPNPSVPELEYKPEEPITSPIEREVFGLEAETLVMGWRLPASGDLQTSAVAQIAGGILSNGQAGLIDLDVIQQQKALFLGGGFSGQPDYSQFYVFGRPKEGQSLEQLRDIALEEIARLRNGEFDEELVSATANNMKLDVMRQFETNGGRAVMYVNAFIEGTPWADYAKTLDRFAAVTKEDVVKFAQQYLKEDNFAVIYKRKGEDTSVRKISAPKITPIVTNRDKQSAFLTQVQGTAVKPIEPVFVDFNKDIARFKLCDGINVLYRQNTINDIFTVKFVFNTGLVDNPALGQALSYIDYLGTDTLSAIDFARKMYSLACYCSAYASANQTTITVGGLSENMQEAVSLVENRLLNAVADETILANLKNDVLKSRIDAKAQQGSCFAALRTYVQKGSDYVKATTLDNNAVQALRSEDLLSCAKDLFTKSHEVLYYGPDSRNDVQTALMNSHTIREDLTPLEEKFWPAAQTPSNCVTLAQYDAKQIYFYQYSNRGEKFVPEDNPQITLYNEYFGGGMNTIVFQEMREARGLAYSASAYLSEPSFTDDTYSFYAFIATQNDKMRTAIEAFDEIINDMPESEAAFSVAKDALDSRLRTERVTGMDIIYEYIDCRRLGLKEPLAKKIFEALPGLTLKDVKATQEKWVKNRSYNYMILGDIKDLDVNYLKTLGPVGTVSLEEIFGY
ncbi:MAG: insulinase family protein [Bacteroidales bacterium]|nr:insulinase family protein [Candidatus Cacconaster caballi]